jgi:DNA-binding HxlR family transcriptional regulator
MAGLHRRIVRTARRRRQSGIRTTRSLGRGYARTVRYGQFCSIARALELLGERWTLLVVRELLCGSRRFGEIQRGIPRVSRTMLSARLRALVDAGVVARVDGAVGPEYELTTAGAELAPLVERLGVWGQRWLPRQVDARGLDPAPLLWDMRRRVRHDALPDRPVLIRIELGRLDRRFLLLRRTEASLCTTNPGFAEDLVIRGDVAALVAWWRGDVDLAHARRAGLAIEGPRELVRAFPNWFARYLLAEVAPAI